jgi:hypothetical protein
LEYSPEIGDIFGCKPKILDNFVDVCVDLGEDNLSTHTQVSLHSLTRAQYADLVMRWDRAVCNLALTVPEPRFVPKSESGPLLVEVSDFDPTGVILLIVKLSINKWIGGLLSFTRIKVQCSPICLLEATVIFHEQQWKP